MVNADHRIKLDRKRKDHGMKPVSMIFVSVIAVFFLAGCTSMNLLNNPRANTLSLAGGSMPVNVGLYVTPLFSEYKYKGNCAAEMSTLNYNLGQASVLLFEDALAQTAKSVAIVDKAPPYASGKEDIAIVIEPSIESFSEDHPVMLRTSKYEAQIAYKVKVYNKEGKVILEKSYTGTGARSGIATHSPGHNFEIAAGDAMNDALMKILKDVAQVVNK